MTSFLCEHKNYYNFIQHEIQILHTNSALPAMSISGLLGGLFDLVQIAPQTQARHTEPNMRNVKKERRNSHTKYCVHTIVRTHTNVRGLFRHRSSVAAPYTALCVSAWLQYAPQYSFNFFSSSPSLVNSGQIQPHKFFTAIFFFIFISTLLSSICELLHGMHNLLESGRDWTLIY